MRLQQFPDTTNQLAAIDGCFTVRRRIVQLLEPSPRLEQCGSAGVSPVIHPAGAPYTVVHACSGCLLPYHSLGGDRFPKRSGNSLIADQLPKALRHAPLSLDLFAG